MNHLNTITLGSVFDLVPEIVRSSAGMMGTFAYVALSSYADENGKVTLSAGQVATLMGASPGATRAALQALVDLDIVARERAVEGAQCIGFTYTLPHPGLGLEFGEDIPRTRPKSSGRRRGTISAAKRLRLYARDGYQCVVCGSSKELNLDHIIPWSKGGTDDDSNLQTMCAEHNQEKGATL